MATSKILYNNPFYGRRTLSSNDDLNNFRNIEYNGMYYISASTNAPANTPTLNTNGAVATYGLLFVFTGLNNSTTCQIYVNRPGSYVSSYIRYYSGSPATWSDWIYVLNSSNFNYIFPI